MTEYDELMKKSSQDWTKDEVMDFAMRDNHAVLWAAIQIYGYKRSTWEIAMQVAAVEQAKALRASNTMLLKYMAQYGALK